MYHLEESQNKHQCICTECGKRSYSDQLTFDFSSLFARELKNCCEEKSELALVDKVINKWRNQHLGPTMLSEQDLIAWTQQLEIKAAGKSSGILAFPGTAWTERVRKDSFFSELSKDESDSLEQIIAQKEDESYGMILETEISYEKVDEGNTRISRVSLKSDDVKIPPVRYCPHCGGEMSFWSGRFPELVLTVVGGPRISKSTALAACASYFLNHGPSYGVTWRGSEWDNSWTNFYSDCVERYADNKRLDATQTGDHAKIPHFSVLVSVKGVEGNPEKKLILTVVDLPGEYDAGTGENGVDFDDNLRQEYGEFYQNVDCVWYCTDKAELEQIDIEQENMERTRLTLGYDIGRKLIRTPKRVDKLGQYAALFRENIPAVFLLGKSDSFQEYDNASSLYQDHYSLTDCKWIYVPRNCSPVLLGRKYHEKARVLRNFLQQRNSKLVSGFENAFKARTYISTSNYGHGFEEDGSSMNGLPLAPFQTELPFLWILAVKGYLMVKDGQNENYADEEKKSLTWKRLCLYDGLVDTYGIGGAARRKRGIVDRVLGRR